MLRTDRYTDKIKLTGGDRASKEVVREENILERYVVEMTFRQCKNCSKNIAQHSFKISCSTRRNWYLPHHGVVNQQKPGKVRVNVTCFCLNHCLPLSLQF